MAGDLPTLASGEHIMALRLFEKLARLSDILYNLVVGTKTNEDDAACADLSLARALGRRPGHACFLPTSATTDAAAAACSDSACGHYESERNSIFAQHENCSDLCLGLSQIVLEQGCCLQVREAALKAWWTSIRQDFDFKVDWRGTHATWRGNATVFRAPQPCQAPADAAFDGSKAASGMARASMPVFERCFFEHRCRNYDFPAASCCRNISCSFGRATSAGACYCRCDRGWAGPRCDEIKAHALIELVLSPLSMTRFLRHNQERFSQLAVTASQLGPADFEWDSIDARSSCRCISTSLSPAPRHRLPLF